MTTKHRRFGDRKEGRRVRSIAPFNKFIPFIMPTRIEASNLYEEQFRIDATNEVLQQLREDSYKGIGMMHFTLAAYIRTLSRYPELNRFVGGQRLYARNKIEASMTVKHEMSIDGEETTIKVEFDPADTLPDVYKKLNTEIRKIKHATESNNTERVAEIFCRLPRFLLRFAIRLIFFADYYDLLPESLLKASPFHATVMITNLGSLGIGPVNHHLYNIGNLPVFIAIGSKQRLREWNSRGELVSHQYMNLKITIDERIADGYYFATFLREFRRIFRNPEELLTPPETITEDRL